MKYGREKTTDVPSPRQRSQRSEMATQTETVTVVTAQPNDVVNYSDLATQTIEGDGQSQANNDEVASKEQKVLPNRAPITSGRGKTFPIASAHCSDHCNQGTRKPATRSAENKSPRRSRVFWRGVDQDTQTDDIKAAAPKEVEPQAPPKRSFFKPNTKPAERVQTVPLAAVSSNDPLVVPAPPPPNRPPPAIPRCTQCDAELSDATKKPVPQIESTPEPESEPEFELHSAPQAVLSHTCTARSSLQCQQCIPSGRTSEPLLPFRSSPASPQRSPQQSRRSTGQNLPPEPITKLSSPVSVEPTPVEDDIGYSTLEGRFLRSNYVNDAISEYAKQSPVADPVKRPSVPRLRLTPTQAPTIPPMQVQSSPPPQPNSSPRAPSSPVHQQAPRKSQPPVVPQAGAPHYHYYSCAPPKPLPQLPPVIIARPFPDTPSVATSLDECAKDRHSITDKRVFKDLHVATAAACDGAVDKWIEEITGYGVRKLLADLSRFKGLGTNTLADVAKRASKQRRGQVRDWELVRESRLQGEPMQQEVHFVKENRGCDEFVDRKEADDWEEYVKSFPGILKERGSDREELLDDMAHKRDCKGVERARERAVKMGWRERSVSCAP
jgi:hypothetical protein